MDRSAGARAALGVRATEGAKNRQQNADRRRFGPVERDQSRRRLANEPRQASMLGRLPHGLGECRRRNADSGSDLVSACQQRDHTTVIPIERDEPARVKRHATHAALRFLFEGVPTPSTESAQARSLAVSCPPVRRNGRISV